MDFQEHCPCCKSTCFVSMDVSGSAEYLALVIDECGSVCPSVCLDCGTIYLRGHYLEMIRERRQTKRKRGIKCVKYTKKS